MHESMDGKDVILVEEAEKNARINELKGNDNLQGRRKEQSMQINNC